MSDEFDLLLGEHWKIRRNDPILLKFVRIHVLVRGVATNESNLIKSMHDAILNANVCLEATLTDKSTKGNTSNDKTPST